MGATKVVGERRSGGADIKRDGSNIKLTENYVFLVETELPNETRVNVMIDRDLPIVGITTTLYGAVCTSISAVRSKENTHFWEVTCVFETGNVKQEGTGPPNTWRPVFELSFETYDEPSYVDANGKRYINSAGDDFGDGYISLKKKLISVDFFQYESISLSEIDISNRNSTVNKTEFAGYEKHTLLLTINKAARGFIGRSAYWRIEYKMIYKKAGWGLKVLDKGFNYIDATTNKSTPFLEGTPPTAYEGLLDGAGKRKTANRPADLLVDEDDLEFIEFAPFEELEFSNFIRRQDGSAIT